MKLIVNPHKIEIYQDQAVNEKEIDISKCEFEFADEITDNYVKEAYFTLNGNTYKQIIVNNQCSFPSEVLVKMGTVEIGVVAYLVEDETEIKRYNPSPVYFSTEIGSLKEAENSEEITPSEMEQYEQALQDGLSEVNGKLEDINTALSQVDNLDIDASKSGTISTVTITKKNGTTKSVQILDGDKGETGIGLQYNWNNTSLGVKREDEVNYQYTNLKGDTGNSGVAMSTTQPSDPTVYVWIDTSDDEVISNAESEEF